MNKSSARIFVVSKFRKQSKTKEKILFNFSKTNKCWTRISNTQTHTVEIIQGEYSICSAKEAA